MIRLLSCLLLSGALSLVQGKPDFSGRWKLDMDQSDDAEAMILGGANPDRMSPKDQRTAERLLALSRALVSLEIRQSAADIRLYDEADNVRIYYIDGKKHRRDTPWGEKLETRTEWVGSELHARTDGKELGDVTEIFGVEGDGLVYRVQLRLKGAKEDTVIRSVYQRAPE